MASERGARRAKETRITEIFTAFEQAIAVAIGGDRTQVHDTTLRLSLAVIAVRLAARRALLPSKVSSLERTELERLLEQNDWLFFYLAEGANLPATAGASIGAERRDDALLDLRSSREIDSLTRLRGAARHGFDLSLHRFTTDVDRTVDELAGANDGDVELLGMMYEANLGETRGSSGSHFTPPGLTSELLAHASLTDARDPPRRICDPSMGTGAILIEACRRLTTLDRSRSDVARDVLYGVDRDPRAVELARLSIWLFCSHRGAAPRDVVRNLRVGDSLTGVSTHTAAPRVARVLTDEKDAFDWPLEFPEVFGSERPGFDRIVANPPFLGGQKISTRLGVDYRRRLVDTLAEGRGGNIDLCAFFLLRAVELLSPSGSFAFIATSTIAQGDTREAGLEKVMARGVTLYRAATKMPWPGKASLEIALVWGTRQTPAPAAVLNGREVEAISAHLAESGAVVHGSPRRIVENRGLAYVGSYVLGRGFVLDRAGADKLCDEDPRSAEVIVPYLDGRDITESCPVAPSRWVIQLDERSEDEARDYRAIWRHLERHVKPERMSKDAIRYPRMVHTWWRHWNNRRALYARTRTLDQMIVRARVSSTHGFAFVPTRLVASEQVVVFAFDDDARFGVLQSSLHEHWVTAHASTLGAGLRYTPSDCLETFPFPPLDPQIAQCAGALRVEREQASRDRRLGLTALYRELHAGVPWLETLRTLTAALDRAVVDAYGWGDLALDHGPYDTPRGKRFCVSPDVARELIRRLQTTNAKLTPTSSGPTSEG
jgi:methylase of polypeptide subunit release factors